MTTQVTRAATARKHSSPISEQISSAPKTRAGAYVTRRYRLPASIADLVASLAGLGLERGDRE